MKILMMYDVKDWAWDRNIQAIIKYLPQYEIESCSRIRQIEKYDHVHAFGWLEATGYPHKISAGVTSHNFVRSVRAKPIYKKIWPKYKALTTNSQILYDIVKEYNENVFLTPNGVHEDIFRPLERPRNKKLVVGWVGQANKDAVFIKHENGKLVDIKGYNLILLKLMKELEGEGIEFRINSKSYTEAVPHEKMPDFYNGVDVQICTSYLEGTPNPLFEASSCGKAIISTRVGAIASCIQDGVNGFIVPSYSNQDDVDRAIEIFKEKILFLRDNRDECEEIGKRGRGIIEMDWTWEKRAKDWIPLFESMR